MKLGTDNQQSTLGSDLFISVIRRIKKSINLYTYYTHEIVYVAYGLISSIIDASFLNEPHSFEQRSSAQGRRYGAH